jgi:hypothetical protein
MSVFFDILVLPNTILEAHNIMAPNFIPHKHSPTRFIEFSKEASSEMMLLA